ASTYAGATEACNLRDDDCDGSTDEGLATQTYYPDCDLDMYGDRSGLGIAACERPATPPSVCAGGGWSADERSDCNDADAAIRPLAPDYCGDDIDSDCDPTSREMEVTWYRDADGDGFYGAPIDEITACTRPPNHARTPGDCNDAVDSVYPGSLEICNGVDDDCDELVDDGASTWCMGRLANVTTSTCELGACAITTCASNFGDCNGVASDGCETDVRTSVSNCGACGMACATRLNSSVACVARACEYACVGSYQNCDGVVGCESDRTTDVEHCGGCGMACPLVANGQRTCVSSTCGVLCDAGYVRVGAACLAIERPRAIAPLSGSVLSTRAPTFRWALGARGDGARVQVCADRACATVEATVDVTGTSTTLPSALSPGRHYWRLVGRAGSSLGTASSPVWHFRVGARSAPRFAVVGTEADYDGDGYDDVVVGAQGAGSGAGAVHVYYGSAAGPSVGPTTSIPGGAGGAFGSGISPVADLNGDGYVDLVVGAPGAEGGEGRAYVFLGGASGLPDVPSFTLTRPVGATRGMGRDVVGLGDINGDGFGDVAVGSSPSPSFAQNVYLFFGSATGLSSTPNATLSAPMTSGYFGYAATAGDLNADGASDLVVASFADDGGGRVYVYLGRLGAAPLATPSTTIVAPVSGGNFGYEVSYVGDLNGDGYGDVVVGNYAAGSGAAYVFHGGASGLGTSPTRSLSAPSDGTTGGFGASNGYAGDVNGDGYDDLLIGNYLYPSSGADRQGRVYVYHGGVSGVGASPSTTLSNPDGTNAYFGAAVGGLDVDGDGYPDVTVGSFVSDNSGRVHIHRGSTGGTSASRSWLFTGPDGASSNFGGALGR
ncbi:MAG: FG-GAP repeat protein, partial [Sandaracinus sp.]|nr:FG-GAP repeat protein [Sandaracinus sp.]